ncbi:MAG: MerR family transcriptional regulator [Acidobacteriaceae bacterium]
MAQQQPARRKMQTAKTPVSIPDKLYFRIGDVARLCSLPAYVLRFWETEFPQLKPHKGGSGQRLYRKRDVEMVLEIKRLLYGEGFTIAGARRSLVEKRHALPATQEAQQERPQLEAAMRPSAPSKAGKPARIAAAGAKNSSGQPRFNELRDEMRALLTILDSGGGDSRPVPVPAKQAKQKKKTRENSSEPTLF